MGFSNAHSSEIKLDSKVPPPGRSIEKKPKEQFDTLNRLLKNAQLGDYYKEASRQLKPEKPTFELNKDELATQLWLIYYIVAAPLFPDDFSNDTPEYYIEEDYDAKQWASNFLFYNSYLQQEREEFLPLPKKQYADLSSLYFASILKSIRDLETSHTPEELEKIRKDAKKTYLDDISQKIEAAKHKFIEQQNPENRKRLEERVEMEKRMIQDREFGRKIIKEGIRDDDDFLQLRKQRWEAGEKVAKSEIRKYNTIENKTYYLEKRILKAKIFAKKLESKFLQMLVTYYPGKAAEVKKYLKLAGYTDEEIPGLIDRTVGRDAKTEFLYS